MQELKSQVIDPGLCIGCGVCAGICLAGAASMSMADTGTYRPCFDDDLCTACGRCVRVCPFVAANADENALAEGVFPESPVHDVAVGRFHSCIAASAPDDAIRAAGSSGGVVTWLLAEALRTEAIDGAWVVGGDASPAFVFARGREELIAAAGSKYHPVHLADVIRETLALEQGTRVAITVLPCQAKALRLACAVSKQLRERVVLVIALTCGQGKSSWYAHHLASPRRGEQVVSIDYRVKRPESGARGYHSVVRLVDERGGQSVRDLAAGQELGGLWERREFSPYACCFCDDLFGECADIACMDAWLPEYEADWRGTSLVVLRTERAAALVSPLMDSGHAAAVSVDAVVRSQAGAYADKTEGEALREAWARRAGLPFVTRRGRGAMTSGIAQRLAWKGAFSIALAGRLGSPHRVGARARRAWGRLLCMLAGMVSAAAVASRKVRRSADKAVAQ